MGKGSAARKPLAEAPRRGIDRPDCAVHAGAMTRLPVSLLALLMVLPAPVAGEERSAVLPYPVKGTSAADIYTDIKTNAPRVAANATFAFTAIATKTDKTHKVDAGGCRYKRFRTSAIYNFVLPRHPNGKALKKGLGGKWLAFVNYLKVHEEGHRDIWRACFADYDAQAMELVAKDCAALDATRERLFTSIKKRCIGQDEAYDVIFRKEVLKHPFMAEALKRKNLKD